MTRLLMCGWEFNDLGEVGVLTSGTLTAAIVASTPTPRSPGAYCLRLFSSSGTFSNTWFTLSLPTVTEVWVRFGFYAHGVPHSNIVQLLDSTGTVQSNMRFQPADNTIRLDGASSDAVIGSVTAPADAWHTIEWHTRITTATTGLFELWVDGTSAGSFSGDTSATSTLNIAQIRIGMMGTAGGSANGYFAYDDLAVNDASGSANNGAIGDGRILLLKPNAAGSSSGFSRGGTNTGANWSQVNEIPPSMTQYVSASSAGVRDLYALENLPTGNWSINACELVSLAQRDTGTGTLAPTVKSGSTTSEGTAQTLGTSSAYVRRLLQTDPATSSAWTVSALNALEAGMTVR